MCRLLVKRARGVLLEGLRRWGLGKRTLIVVACTPALGRRSISISLLVRQRAARRVNGTGKRVSVVNECNKCWSKSSVTPLQDPPFSLMLRLLLCGISRCVRQSLRLHLCLSASLSACAASVRLFLTFARMYQGGSCAGGSGKGSGRGCCTCAGGGSSSRGSFSCCRCRQRLCRRCRRQTRSTCAPSPCQKKQERGAERARSLLA